MNKEHENKAFEERKNLAKEFLKEHRWEKTADDIGYIRLSSTAAYFESSSVTKNNEVQEYNRKVYQGLLEFFDENEIRSVACLRTGGYFPDHTSQRISTDYLSIRGWLAADFIDNKASKDNPEKRTR